MTPCETCRQLSIALKQTNAFYEQTQTLNATLRVQVTERDGWLRDVRAQLQDARAYAKQLERRLERHAESDPKGKKNARIKT